MYGVKWINGSQEDFETEQEAIQFAKKLGLMGFQSVVIYPIKKGV